MPKDNRTPTYVSWQNMKRRCNSGSAYYGGRGITYCPAWDSYSGFLADMGARPEGTSLDRINPDGDYCPSNCRWATKSEQSRNRRDRKQITAFGKTQFAVDWCAETGVKIETLLARLRSGWPAERALTEPPVNPRIRFRGLPSASGAAQPQP